MSGDDEDDVPDAVELPITDELDLHTFAPKDVRSVVEEYLKVCLERGILVVRIVHGRGKGVQRAIVRQLLRELPDVIDFADAPDAGGWGATRVTLRGK